MITNLVQVTLLQCVLLLLAVAFPNTPPQTPTPTPIHAPRPLSSALKT